MTGTFHEALKQGRTAMPLQKRRAAAVGKWHSACPEVRLYRSKVDGEKTLPPAGKLCNPCLRASRRPHGRGKTVTVAKGWGLVTNNAFGRINAAIICDGRMKLDRSTTVIDASESK